MGNQTAQKASCISSLTFKYTLKSLMLHHGAFDIGGHHTINAIIIGIGALGSPLPTVREGWATQN